MHKNKPVATLSVIFFIATSFLSLKSINTYFLIPFYIKAMLIFMLISTGVVTSLLFTKYALNEFILLFMHLCVFGLCFYGAKSIH